VHSSYIVDDGGILENIIVPNRMGCDDAGRFLTSSKPGDMVVMKIKVVARQLLNCWHATESDSIIAMAYNQTSA